MGWFYGFKSHLITSDTGDLLSVQVTPGNVDDRKPVEALSQDLLGKLFGDKGYVSQALLETLIEHFRHRSPASFAVNLLAELVAYTLQPKNPSIRLPDDLPQLPALI